MPPAQWHGHPARLFLNHLSPISGVPVSRHGSFLNRATKLNGDFSSQKASKETKFFVAFVFFLSGQTASV
jgi:hypothetical protein